MTATSRRSLADERAALAKPHELRATAYLVASSESDIMPRQNYKKRTGLARLDSFEKRQAKRSRVTHRKKQEKKSQRKRYVRRQYGRDKSTLREPAFNILGHF